MTVEGIFTLGGLIGYGSYTLDRITATRSENGTVTSEVTVRNTSFGVVESRIGLGIIMGFVKIFVMGRMITVEEQGFKGVTNIAVGLYFGGFPE